MVKPIFFDETGRRWFKVKVYFYSFLFLLGIFMFVTELNRQQILNISLIDRIYISLLDGIITVFYIYLIVAIIIGFVRLLILFIFSRKHYNRRTRERKQKNDKQQRVNNQNGNVKKIYFDEILAIEYSRQRRNRYGRHKYRQRNRVEYRPIVTIIIPVFNEEAVILDTVRAILRSNYPLAEILVIDDGSTDETANIVAREFYFERKVKLIKKENGGKASVLNIGFKNAIGDIIVTIDADTAFTEHTVANLVTHFKNPQIAAVAGNCRIGNIRNQLTLWQHIEYVTANNLERRACEELNCITVVPGSNSAWRKSVVKEVGYYDYDTLAEDTDLTIKILNHGYKVVYADEAISYEECPDKISDFLKQRYRWAYGILQSAWKHKWSILQSENKVIKYFSASMLFSYLLYLTSPIVDLIFIIALFSGSKSIYLFVIIFYITDMLAPAYALKLEGTSMKPLVWVFFQRIAYRYLIAYVTWKTVLVALKGNHVGWNKFERSGTNMFIHKK